MLAVVCGVKMFILYTIGCWVCTYSCLLYVFHRIVLPVQYHSSVFLTSSLGIVIQGESPDELPEHVLACAALKYIDVDVHSPLESYNF